MSDAEDRGVKNLISQYNDSTNLKLYVTSLVSPFNGMLDGLRKTRRERDIAQGTGQSLDIIGGVVGAHRVVPGGESAGWFGYYEDPLSLGTGTVDNPLVGGILYDINLPISRDLYLEDKDYRQWIYGRILLNSRNRSVENVIQFIRHLFMAETILPFEVNEQYDPLMIDVVVTGELNTKLRAVFSKRLPLIRPAGIPIQLSDDTGNIQLEY